MPLNKTTQHFNISSGMAAAKRKLTPEEIDDVVSVIPEIKAAIAEIADINRANIVDVYYKNIANFSMSEQHIPEFISRLKIRIYNTFQRSLIQPGIPVGPRAAEAIAVPMIQATLDSFKTTGASVSTYGEETAREIISLSSRDPSIIRIFFNDPTSDIEILRDKRPDLVEILVSDVIDPKYKFEVDDPYSILGENEPVWYQIHRGFSGEKNPSFLLGNRMMRIHLNVNLMFEHKITVSKIVKIILGFHNGKSLNEEIITCVPSPILTKIVPKEVIRQTESGARVERIEDEVAYAYIDIFLKPIDFGDIADVYSSVQDPDLRGMLIKETWFETVLLPSFNKMRIKGIEGIKNVFIEKTLTTQIINKEVDEVVNFGELELPSEFTTSFPEIMNRITPDQKITFWKTYYSPRRIKSMGIGPDKLAHLFQLCGIIILPYTSQELEEGFDSSYMRVIVPERDSDYDRVMLAEKLTEIENEQDEEKKNSLQQKLEKERFELITPLKWVNYKKKIEENEDNEFTKNKKADIVKYASKNVPDNFEFSARRIKNPKSSIILAYEITYALVEGINLKEVLKRSDVDVDRTYSNDFFEIYNFFGIEALRNFILEELVGYAAASGYISRRHMLLLADFMTYRGIPTKITYTGLQDEFEDTLKGVGFERPGAVIAESAMAGSKERMLSVISSTLLGREANSGEVFKDTFITDRYKSKLKAEQELEDITVEEMEQQIDTYQRLSDKLVETPGIPSNIKPNISSMPEISEKMDVEIKIGELGTGEDPVTEALQPSIGSAPVTQNIVKNTFDKLISIKDIFEASELEQIQLQPLGERAVISQLPAMKPEEQEQIEAEIKSIPIPEVQLEQDTDPNLMSLLEQSKTIDLPIDI